MAQQYRPLYKLDSGGMAEVYVAEAEAMAGFTKKVAIKRILPGLLKDEKFVRMFLDEARLSLHLNHANIVSVFDIGKSDNTYFIVMEFVHGTTLKSVMEYCARRNTRLPVALTIWIVNEILKGLDYAHSLKDESGVKTLGIVHRDISPPNVLVSWNGEVKLVDFGLAKATTQLESTDPGVVKGKFAYLSPEAAHGNDVDHRTDIFAVGILAFEMLTGQRLFLGENDFGTVELVRKAEIPSLRALNPDVPDELEAIIRKALAREVEDRYQQCGELADALLGFLFRNGMMVSSRDLQSVLVDVRKHSKKPDEKKSQSNLILQLMADEMANFRSIDDSGNSVLISTGAHPLESMIGEEMPDYDPSAPLTGFDSDPTPSPVSTPDTPANQTQPEPEAASSGDHANVEPTEPPSTLVPSPAPKAEGGRAGLWIGLLLVAAAGGGAAYYFLVLAA